MTCRIENAPHLLKSELAGYEILQPSIMHIFYGTSKVCVCGAEEW